MKSINIYILFLILFALSSCENEIDFNGKISESLVVVNSLIKPDSVLSVHLSKSNFFLSSDNNFTTINDADISVFVNGVFKEKLLSQSNGYYKSTFIPAISDSISLSVEAAGKKTINCGTKIPTAPTIISVDTIINYINAYPSGPYTYSTEINGQSVMTDTTSWRLSIKMKVKIRVKDNPYRRNFYQVSPSFVNNSSSSSQDGSTNGYSSYSDGYLDVTLVGSLSDDNSENFMDPSGAYNSYKIFSDDFFNGKEYTVAFLIEGYTSVPVDDLDNAYLYLNLRELNADYYKYLNTKDLQSSSDGFFTEQVQVYSNINNGVGIIGAYSNSGDITKIKVRDLINRANKSGVYSNY